MPEPANEHIDAEPVEVVTELAAAQAGRYYRHVVMLFPPGQLMMTILQDRPGDPAAFLFNWSNEDTGAGPHLWDVMPIDLERTRSVYAMAQLPLRRFFPPPEDETEAPADDN